MHSISIPLLVRRVAASTLLACAVLGCQGRGDVSGMVMFQKKPLVFGTVMVVGSDGQIHQGNINADGSYTVTGVSLGEARIAVNSRAPDAPVVRKSEYKEDPNSETARQRAALKAQWFPIPAKYGDPNTSGLTLEVKRGTNAHPIELE
jgi:hypothetical protein